MEELKTQAIVLKNNDYKDSGRMLTIFSLEKGLIYAKINGVLKPKAKLAFAAQPFCFGEYVLVNKFGYTVIGCSGIENFYDLTKDFDKFIAGEGVLEVISYLAKPEESNPQLFLLMLKALKTLNYSKAQPLSVFIKFLIEALTNAGYKLELNKCAVCGNISPLKEKFSFEFGGRVCSICSQNEGINLSCAQVAVLKNINMTNFEKLENLNFKNLDSVMSVAKILVKYFYDKTGENLQGISEYL